MNSPALASVVGFAPESRVWVYITNRRLSPAESARAQEALDAFARQWTAHNQALRAAAEVFENRFVLLMVDETQAGASGCSIDKSVHFLETLGRELGVDFFERMQFGWLSEAGLEVADRERFGAQVRAGHISGQTPVVNTMVQSKKELAEKWLLPFEQSWHRRLV